MDPLNIGVIALSMGVGGKLLYLDYILARQIFKLAGSIEDNPGILEVEQGPQTMQSVYDVIIRSAPVGPFTYFARKKYLETIQN